MTSFTKNSSQSLFATRHLVRKRIHQVTRHLLRKRVRQITSHLLGKRARQITSHLLQKRTCQNTFHLLRKRARQITRHHFLRGTFPSISQAKSASPPASDPFVIWEREGGILMLPIPLPKRFRVKNGSVRLLSAMSRTG